MTIAKSYFPSLLASTLHLKSSCPRLHNALGQQRCNTRRTSSTDNNSSLDEMSEPDFPSVDSNRIPLPPPPDLQNKAPRKYWNAVALAFLGDGVWEMYVRRKFFYPPSKMSQYYNSVIKNVRAEAQEDAYNTLANGSILGDEEKSILKWGLNATGTSPKRLSSGPIKKQTYRAATAVECLIGYLYLTDQDRLHEVLEFLDLQPKKAAATKEK